MSITVRLTVNGHSAEVTVEYPEMLSKAIDETVKALSAIPYQLAPQPQYGPRYPPGFQFYKDVVTCNGGPGAECL